MSFDLRVKQIQYDDLFPVHIDWSPCGRFIALGFNNGVVQLITPEGESVWRLIEPHDDMVRRVAFSPDGTQLASTSIDNHFCIWNVENGELVVHHELEEPVIFPVWSPDGKKLWMDGPDCRALLRDPLTFETEYQGVEHYEHTTCAAWGPGDILASGSFDNFVHITDLKTKDYVYSLTCFKEEIVSVCALKRDKFVLVTGTADGQLTIHDIETGLEVMNDREQGKRINDIKSNANGRAFATAGLDKTIRVYSPDLGKEILNFPYFQEETCSVAFSPDGNLLASASIVEGLCIWEVGPWIPDFSEL